VPVTVTGSCVKAGIDLGTRSCFGDLGQTVAEYLGTEPVMIGKSFLDELI
jgi:phosphopentomutase